MDNYVVYPITLIDEVEIFRTKNYFMLIGVEAPIMKRLGFYNVKYVKRKSSLADFLEVDDKVNYGIGGYPATVYEVMYMCDKIIVNRGEKDELYTEVR